MIRIEEITPQNDFTLWVKLSSGRVGYFDVKPFWDKGCFVELKNQDYFIKVQNRGRSVFWPHEQDFSADTIEVLLTEKSS